MAERSRPDPEGRRMWFRVCIHLCDVIMYGDDIYGDCISMAP